MIKSTTTSTLTNTMIELKLADSLMPLISSIVTATDINRPGRFMMPWTVVPSASVIVSNGPLLKASGKFIPNVSLNRLTT